MNSSYDQDLQNAFEAAANPNWTDEDIKLISAITPQIVMRKDAEAAHKLLTLNSPNRGSWMAEAFALSGTYPTSHGKAPREMMSALYAPRNEVKSADILRLYGISRNVGYLGFSFPLWRFVSQGFGEDRKALLEHFGMQKLKRDNDTRNENLPHSNPERDEFGAGFFWTSGQTSIEFRRSYIACTISNPSRPVTLIIRNSSYFFGRDRLPEAAYVSFTYKTPKQLRDFKLEDVTAENSNFTPLQNILNTAAIPSTTARMQSLVHATHLLTSFNNRLSDWLVSDEALPDMECKCSDIQHGTNKTGGKSHLIKFLQEQLGKAKDKTPLYLGYVLKSHPAWNLRDVQPLNDETMQNIAPHKNDNFKFALLSGPHGDFPLGHKYSKELAQQQSMTPSTPKI